MPASEIKEITLQENLIDDALPDWVDEDKHLNDDEHEWAVYYAELNDAEEYETLRSIGLTHPEAEKVVHHG